MRGEELPLQRQFDVIIERDEEGYTTSLRSHNSTDAIPKRGHWMKSRCGFGKRLCLEEQGAPGDSLEFIGIQRITVAA